MSDTNGKPIPFRAPEIPIVGQPCTVHGWAPTIMLTCNCQAKTPLMLIGFGAVVECPPCGGQYGIHEIVFNAVQGGGSVTVRKVGQAPRPLQ